MNTKYPKRIKLRDKKYTYIDTNGKRWRQEFSWCGNFYEGLASVRLEDGKYTYVDTNGKMWEQRFEWGEDFNEGLAVVGLEDGKFTYVDTNGKLWEQRFKWCGEFNKGLASVRLEDDKCTYVDTNGKLWEQKFDWCHPFYDDIAFVDLNGLKYYVTKSGKLYDSEDEARQAIANNNSNTTDVKKAAGLLKLLKRMQLDSTTYPKIMQLQDGSWTFVDENGKLWKQRFKWCNNFKKGLAEVQLLNSQWVYVDKAGVLYDSKFEARQAIANSKIEHTNNSSTNNNSNTTNVKKLTGLLKQMQMSDIKKLNDNKKILDEISKTPSKFLDLPTQLFKDEKFIKDCVLRIRTVLKAGVDTADDINEYAKYCTNLLNSVKEKVEKEKSKLEESETKKQNLLNTIDNFIV